MVSIDGAFLLDVFNSEDSCGAAARSSGGGSAASAASDGSRDAGDGNSDSSTPHVSARIFPPQRLRAGGGILERITGLAELQVAAEAAMRRADVEIAAVTSAAVGEADQICLDEWVLGSTI